MKFLVTGANGFLGNYVVTEALRRGHTVRALVRPATDVTKFEWSSNSRVEIARADLRNREELAEALRNVDGVVHLAAAKSGDYTTQYESTFVATENLLSAMTEAGVKRLVAASSFSVYDFTAASPSVALDETSLLEKDALKLDAYARIKLLQESLVREYAGRHGIDLVVLRPGMIWGRGHLLNAWIGMPAGRRIWLRTGARARVPLTYVENCAEAVMMASESNTAQGQILNVVDDDLPTQRQFARLVLSRISPRRLLIPIPYLLLRLAAGTAELLNRRMLNSRARLPGLLIPSRLDARAKPLIYSNQRIKRLLGWTPRYSLHEGLDRSLAAESPAVIKATA
jgi:nucleoside-diphosphate-sugar epimerase